MLDIGRIASLAQQKSYDSPESNQITLGLGKPNPYQQQPNTSMCEPFDMDMCCMVFSLVDNMQFFERTHDSQISDGQNICKS